MGTELEFMPDRDHARHIAWRAGVEKGWNQRPSSCLRDCPPADPPSDGRERNNSTTIET